MASLGMLVAGIPHEINTPLGSISSMYDTLMRATEKLKGVLAVVPTNLQDRLEKAEKKGKKPV